MGTGLSCRSPNKSHPSKVRYRSDLPDVLRGMSLTVPQGARVGVLGRTGAGKSSLLLLLCRLNSLSKGHMSMAGLDVDHTPLSTWRHHVTLMAQDAPVFCGSLRFNLDPCGHHNDDKLWAALTAACLAERARKSGGLEMELSENGGNLSAGEKQLLSLARALLRKTKLVLIDEVGACIFCICKQA